MMFPVILVFVLGAGAVFALHAAITHLPGIMARRALDRRLHDISAAPEQDGSDESSVLKRALTGPLPQFDEFMAKSRSGGWLVKLIEQAGSKTTPSSIVVTSLGLAAGFAILAMLFSPAWFAPIIAGLVGSAIPVSWLYYKRGARLRRFEEQFPEALDLLSRAIRAGHAFQTALGMVGDDLTPPVGPEFKKTFDEQNFGLPLRDALFQLTERVPILDVRFFVTAVLIQRETGGNLAEILDNLAHVVRERFKIRRQVRVHTAHGRFTGYVLLALPVALSIALSFINPEHMQVLFRERMGQMMLAACIVMQTIGYFWIRKVIKIEV